MMRCRVGEALNVGYLGYRAVVMTPRRGPQPHRLRRLVLHRRRRGAACRDRPRSGSWVFVRCSSDDRTKPAAPEDLTLLAGRGTEAGETLTAGDLLAASQASLNEIVAAIIRDGPAGRWQAGNALNALRYHNWASGFTFEGEPASDAPWDRPLQDAAVRKTRGLEAGKRYRAKRAQAEADALKHGLPYGAAPVKRRGFRADETALVYLVTHAGYRAAKVGIADTAGVTPGGASPGRLADPGGIPGHRQGGHRDRDRHSRMVARRARAAVLPQSRPDAPGRMDGDRCRGRNRPGGDGGARL